MVLESLISLFKKDLEKLKKEIESYKSEKNLWRVSEGISNSGGNLCLHIVGNLNTYIGVVFGKTSYVRQRDLEFSLKDIPKATLLKQIDDVLLVVEKSLNQLTEIQLSDEYPFDKTEKKTETGYMLIHLASHLNYHLGQINYHRRLLDK